MIDFLCIGAQKAGTTWLMANLDAHPEVWTPPFIKELHYFDAIHLGFSKPWLLRKYAKKGKPVFNRGRKSREYFHKLVDPAFAFTDEWYRHVFSMAPSGSKCGECTPLYCALHDEGIRHVAALLPNVRLIYIIRDPADRMRSSLRMAMQRRSSATMTAMKPLLDNELFLKRGDYMGNIIRWETYLPPDRILYIPFGDVREEPQSVMRRVEAHIGICPHSSYPFLTETVHVTNKQGVEFDPGIIQRIEEVCEPQREFLVKRFGADFAERTK